MDPLCRAVHDRPDPACRCNEYAKVRADERRALLDAADLAYRALVPAHQGRMSAEQKTRVSTAIEILAALRREP